ncbi:MAG TPA: hypothetical protein VFL42_14355 [Terriglobales bacterium]|nr:hypothetical protein [Terriglobales bacterium]
MAQAFENTAFQNPGFEFTTVPQLISYAETAWNTTAISKSTAAINWNAGDVIVVIAGCARPTTLGGPNATGLDFILQQSNSAAFTCPTLCAAAVAASAGSDVVNMTNLSGTVHWGFGVFVWRNSQGIGNSAEQHTSSRTVALTPSTADGVMMWGVFDFGATVTQPITPSPTDMRQALFDSGNYTVYLADLGDQPNTGSTNYGLGGIGSGPYSIVAIEVQAVPTGPASSIYDEDYYALPLVQKQEPVVIVC